MTGAGRKQEGDAPGACAGDALLDLAVGLIAAQGWPAFSLERLAADAGMPEAELRRHFATRYDVLVALSERADQAMWRLADEIQPEDSAHDRLHALVMERLQASAGDRAALRRVIRAVPLDPLLAAVHLRNLHAWAERTLVLAGLDSRRPLIRLARIKLLAGGVILPVLPVWLGDESTDLARTDAAVDRAVSRAIGLFNLPAGGSRLEPHSARPGDPGG